MVGVTGDRRPGGRQERETAHALAAGGAPLSPADAPAPGEPPAEVVLTLDPAGRVRGCGAQGAAVGRAVLTGLVGRHVSCLYPPGEVAAGAPARALAAAVREGSHAESGRRLRADGSSCRAETVVTAVRDAQDRPAGFSVTVRELPAEGPAGRGRRGGRLPAGEADRQRAAAREQEAREQRAREDGAREERRRLVRELHDSVSPALYGIALGARAAREAVGDLAEAAAPVDDVCRLADAGLAELRALLLRPGPEPVAAGELVAGLARHVEAVRVRYGIAAEAVLGAEPETTPEARHALDRIARESLHNAVRHAAAHHVVLRLLSGPSTVTLVVSDDGVGFDARGSFPGGLGLRGMRERAREVGGTLRVDSRPGRGSRVRATVPAGVQPTERGGGPASRWRRPGGPPAASSPPEVN